LKYIDAKKNGQNKEELKKDKVNDNINEKVLSEIKS
jgi:hypothetical protein